MVDQYLSSAEFKEEEGCPMRRTDWQETLDGVLRANRRPILEHTGRISAERARAKAARELVEYEARRREGGRSVAGSRAVASSG
jgi:hypothetical protein